MTVKSFVHAIHKHSAQIGGDRYNALPVAAGSLDDGPILYSGRRIAEATLGGAARATGSSGDRGCGRRSAP